MTTATSEKIQTSLANFTRSFTASMKAQASLSQPAPASFEAIRQAIQKNGQAQIECQRAMAQALQETLREGMEEGELRRILATLLSTVEPAVIYFTSALAIYEGDKIIEAQLREAASFLDWLRKLAANASAPVPPFDESKLPPVSGGPAGAAGGFVSVSEARARLRAAGKQL